MYSLSLKMDVRVFIIVVSALHASFHWAATVPPTPTPDLDRCYSCQDMDLDFDVCHCDDECDIYGDCCGSVTMQRDMNVFKCRSVFVDGSTVGGEDGVEKAFWMVESCLLVWNGTKTEGDCTNRLNFYPVTDTNTGVVYSNEHCATCNSISGDTLLHWSYSLVCSDTLLNLTQQPNFTLTLEALMEHCEPCSYAEPAPFNLTSPPGLPAPPPRPCYLNTASCVSKDSLEAIILQNVTDEQYSELVENCTNGPYSLVKDSSHPNGLYRNQYCAVCNGVKVVCAGKETQVDYCTYHRSISGGPDDQGSFSIVMDIFGDGLIVVKSEVITTIVTVICSEGQVFDPVIGDCRQTVCPEGFVLKEGTCKLSSDMTLNDTFCPDGFTVLEIGRFEHINNDTLLINGTLYDVLLRDPVGRPVVCLSIPSCPSYIALTEEDDFEFVDNDTVLYSDEEQEVVFWNAIGQPVICINFSIIGTREVNVTILTYSYPGGFMALTYIGCSLSVLGCALILLTYGLFKELRTLPSKILMNLAAAILVSNLFLLLYNLGGDSQDFCIATAIILHLFFLAQFSWMSIMTFEMGRTFNQARILAPESSEVHKMKLFITYSLIGWGIPAIIVGTSVAVNFSTDDLVLYGETEDGEEGRCWINHVESALVAFVAPVAVSILFNAIVFAFVSFWLVWAWKTETKLSKKGSIPYLRVYLAIVSITGLTWIFGFLAILAGTNWSWYPFIILNSFQGFTIFVLFLLTRKVLNRYLACLTCGRVEVESLPWPSITKSVLKKIIPRTSIETHHAAKPDSAANCKDI